MRTLAQRGILLLPVALMLAVVGALAYTMTREGGMNASAVDAEYDAEVARYLAEAGMNLAKWQNMKLGCYRSDGFGDVDLPGGRISAKDSDITGESEGRITVDILATTPSGAAHRLRRSKIVMYRLNAPGQVTLASAGAIDTFIKSGVGGQGNSSYLEMSDNSAFALVEFSDSMVPDDAMIVNAQLKLYLYDYKSAQAGSTLSAHRAIRHWGDTETWSAAWAESGSAYAPGPADTLPVGVPAEKREYVFRIDELVEGWANNTFDNEGVLLKAGGMGEARFASFENTTYARPKLVVNYYPRCT